ncbi:hypothetical protein OPV22_009782 [Ensete ventricosum]|uniref:Protein dehydration-induced 19 C-terminal domain-containing protein n=1 Tax=Ensete ventricosum TaxID=4639 RepID=A0AAV8RBU7_ENSVE|nr:hypothetical protein OPV22_009782 [Ensete ventricosum]
MDSDLWISRLAAAKRHYSIQHQYNFQSDRLSFDEFEMEEDEEEEDDVRPDFPCPYCYEDHDITSPCSHLAEEHAFESKSADYLQRHRRLGRFGIPSSHTLSLLGRDLHESHLQVLLGSAGYGSNHNDESNIAADPLLSTLMMNFPTSEAEEASKPFLDENSYRKKESSSLNPSSLAREQKEQRQKQEAAGRANFVQDLLFGD